MAKPSKKSYDQMSDEELDLALAAEGISTGDPDFDSMTDEELDQALAAEDESWDGTPEAPAAAAPSRSLVDRLSNAAMGLGKGMSFSYYPQIQAGIDMAEQAVRTGKIPSKEDYARARDTWATALSMAEEEDPTVFGASQIAGGILTGAALPGGATVKAASKLPKALRVVAPIVTGGATAAATGFVENPGDVRGEVGDLQLSERLQNAKNAGMMGALFPVGGRMLEKGARVVKRAANESAFKALGPFARDVKKVVGDKAKLRELVDEDMAQEIERRGVQGIGEDVLENKIIGNWPVGRETISARAATAADRKGRDLGNYLGELQDASMRAETQMADELQDIAESAAGDARAANQAAFKAKHGDKAVIDDKIASRVRAHDAAQPKPRAPRPSVGVDRQMIADQMRAELINPNRDIPGISQKNWQVERLIRQFERGDDSIIGVLDAEMKKRSVGKEINWDRLKGADIPVEEQVQRSLYHKLQRGVEDAADFLEKNAGGPKAGTFKRLKNAYGNLSTAARIAQKRSAHETANQFLSPTDVAALAVGSAYGFTGPFGPQGQIKSPDAQAQYEDNRLEMFLPAITLLTANKIRRHYGSQIFSNAANKTSRAMDLGAKGVRAAGKNPWAIAGGAQAITKGAKNGEEKQVEENWDEGLED